jgi:hypothetical protein
MKLLTKALEKRFDRIGRQESAGENAIVIAKFFTPDSNWSWFATEYDPVDRIFFGLVQGLETEYGYFSRDELEGVRGPMGLPIERDKYWSEKTVGEVRELLEERGWA